MPRWEVILHEARREAVEVMRVWRLVELRVLLMRGERPPEVRGTLHAEGGLPLAPAPRGLLVLVVPRCLKLIVPGGVRLVVPGGFTLAVPSGLPLLIPHPFVVTVPGGAMGRALMMGEWGLLWGLQEMEGDVSDKEQGGGGEKAGNHIFICKRPRNFPTRAPVCCPVPAAAPKGQRGGVVQTRVAYLEEYAHEVQAHEAPELQDPGPQPPLLHSRWSPPAELEPSHHLKERGSKLGNGQPAFSSTACFQLLAGCNP